MINEQLKPYPQSQAWTDLETAGLNGIVVLDDGTKVNGAEYYPILEVALILPKSNAEGIVLLDEAPTINVGIKMNKERLERLHSWALKQHTKSGLLDRLETGEGFDFVEESTEEAEKVLIEWLEKNGVTEFDRETGTGAILFGNNVGFDLDFIQAQMPTLAKRFHYRKGDVSAVNIFSRTDLWKHAGFAGIEKQLNHTALSDIHESIYEMNAYTEQLNVLLWYKEQAQKAGIMFPETK